MLRSLDGSDSTALVKQTCEFFGTCCDSLAPGASEKAQKDGGSDICNDMAKDPAYDDAVDIVGLHYPSDFADYSTCHSLKKPFWASEESSSYDDINGHRVSARGLVRRGAAAPGHRGALRLRYLL